MDATELAKKMLAWEKARSTADKLEREIVNAVLEIKSTKVTGNTEAKFTNGRRQLDYETPAKSAQPAIIDRHTKFVESVDWEGAKQFIDPDLITEFTRKEKVVDWKSVCKDARIEPATVSEGTPSVKLRIIE